MINVMIIEIFHVPGLYKNHGSSLKVIQLLFNKRSYVRSGLPPALLILRDQPPLDHVASLHEDTSLLIKSTSSGSRCYDLATVSNAIG